MKNVRILVILVLLATAPTVWAQSPAPLASSPTLTEATEKYKASSVELLRLQEEELQQATHKLEQVRQLVAEGLLAQRELETEQQAVTAIETKIANTKQQIAGAEQTIAEIKAAEAAARLASLQPKQPRSLVKPTVMRYGGAGGWSMTATLTSVQSFFANTFGRALPTSAIGQSATHNRLGWDHRNAVDVGLHPDSAEGRALIGYLQSRGIPFLAFRGAIPGVATGPHIHIGNPSHRWG